MVQQSVQFNIKWSVSPDFLQCDGKGKHTENLEPSVSLIWKTAKLNGQAPKLLTRAGVSKTFCLCTTENFGKSGNISHVFKLTPKISDFTAAKKTLQAKAFATEA